MHSLTNSVRTSRSALATVPLIAAAIALPLFFTGCSAENTEVAPTKPAASAPAAPNEAPSEAEAQTTVEPFGAKGALAATDLTEESMLLFAVQDEYLARAQYAEIITRFETQNPYSNIMSSEESHLAALRGIYAARGVEFPADTSAEHVVIPTTLLEAAQTGVQGEIENIAMFDRFLATNPAPDVAAVFTELRNGSVSHLNAFEAQVNRLS